MTLEEEYDLLYAQGVEDAANAIWQSITHGPGAAPDWDVWEFLRPGGGWQWRRPTQGVTIGARDDEFQPFDWERMRA